MASRKLITQAFSSTYEWYQQGYYDGVASSLEKDRETLKRARAESEHVSNHVDATAMYALDRAIEIAKEGKASKDFDVFYLYLANAMKASDTTPDTSHG